MSNNEKNPPYRSQLEAMLVEIFKSSPPEVQARLQREATDLLRREREKFSLGS